MDIFSIIFLCGAGILCATLFSNSQRKITFLRGRPRLKVIAGSENSSGNGVMWGTELLPIENATTHFLVAGTTGAGKTLLINRLMQSVLPHIGKDRRDLRALVYDAKGDSLRALHSMASCRIVTLHPFDQRGAAWDMARDITTPAAALQASTILVRRNKNDTGNPFFILAAQNLMRGVFLTFMQTVGTNWTLSDVILTLRFEERLRLVLSKTLEGQAILDQFFQTGSETLQGVRATLATAIAPYEAIAACWDTAKEKVSLADFMAGEFILVLGNDESTRTALDAINCVLFQRLSELILSGEESRNRQTWLFLDEVREAGRLEGLSRLMTKGRSKGACVVLGFQAIEGMREVYGTNGADEIAGLCNNKAILRLESAVSAQWASDLFGQVEEIERRRSSSSSHSDRGLSLTFGRSRSVSEQRMTTSAVLPSEVMTLSPTNPKNGLNGFFITRSRGAYRAHVPWNQLKSRAKNHAYDDFLPRPSSSQYLREWTLEDAQRLALSVDVLAASLSRSTESYTQNLSRHRHLRAIRK